MEIEIKAMFEDRGAIESKLRELGAVEEKQKHQIDEYYNHPSRDTRKTKEYIRLRHKPGGATGIFAYHVNLSDGVTREQEIKVDNLVMFKDMLKSLNFPLLGTIDKQRKVYRLNHFFITLDEVKDIGNFIEIEVAGHEHEVNEKKTQCIAMLEMLGLSRDDIRNDIWLCDIATGKGKL